MSNPKVTLQEAHQILGLDPSRKLTMADLKTRYRELLLQYHPDKNNAAFAHDKFIEIKHAYELVKGSLSGDVCSGDDEEENIWVSLFDIIVQKLNQVLVQQHQRKVNDIEIQYQVTLDEMYKGITKRFVVNVCDSFKRLVGKETIYISLKDFKEKHFFPSKGDHRDDGTRTDVHIRLNIIEHPHFKIDKYIFPHDLSIEFDISLNEYYTRKEFVFMFFEQMIEVPYTSGSRVHVKRGYGLPYYNEHGEEVRGDMYIYFNLTLPKFTEVPSDVQTVLRKYFVHSL